MRIEHGDHRITLYYERPPNLRAMATLHALFMGGFTCFLLLGAVYVLIAARGSNPVGTAVLFVACAAFAAWNGATSLFDPDITTVFDLKARTAALTERSIVTRQRGPVPFDDIVSLGTRVGFASNHRSVIAELTLADGECWRLGYELIRLKPSASSEIPGVIKRLRKATGLAGEHTE
jgi:hypothetical protein